uniref:hypothetical protein n=1 Tax=Altererythrobacter segetis TaxID=1104773 RepID=UPI00140A34BB|nr:hypothetical protein [Altererythrobacter segetis]
MVRKLFFAASVFSLVVAPVAAQAAERQPSPVAGKEDIAGMSMIGLLIALAVVAGVALIIASDDNNNPVSP